MGRWSWDAWPAMPEPIAIGSVNTAWGPMQLATTPRGILLIERGDDPAPLLAEVQRRLPRSDLDGTEPDQLEWLAGWIAGERRDLAPVDLRGLSDFDAAVYRAVREIGWGDRATYGDIAMAVGPTGRRASGGRSDGALPHLPGGAVPPRGAGRRRLERLGHQRRRAQANAAGSRTR